MKYQLIGNPPNVAVPTHFYKIILATKEDKDSPDGKSYALGTFLMPNQRIPHNDPLDNYLVPLDALERTTGLQFFTGLDNKTVTPLCDVVKCVPIPPTKHVEEKERERELKRSLPLPEEKKSLPLNKEARDVPPSPKR